MAPADEASDHTERRFRALVEHSADLITLVDDRMTIRFQSPSIEQSLGWTAEEVIGLKPIALVHPGDRSRVILYWRHVLERPGVHPPIDFRALAKDGRWCTVETIANNLLDQDELATVVLTTRDIADRRELETQLAHQAFHDTLTGLANRALFNDRIKHALAVAERKDGSVAVLFLDLDDFKEVNDSLGHQAGDQLLIATARRIEVCLRQGDTAARLSGDEFGILLERATRESAAGIAKRVLERLREPVAVAGKELCLRASVGIALSDTDGRSAEELLRNADTAMYRAKASGKSSFALFKQSMHAAALRRLELRGELEGATARGEMSLRYQPIFDLATGTIAGFEVLLRWTHPRRGIIPPEAFIPLAEEMGVIVQIGHWALEAAVQQLRAWGARWPDEAGHLWLSINLSLRQLAERDLPTTVEETLRRAGIEGSRLIVEVTESALAADAEAAAERLTALRRLGIRVAVDDFGTGHSSLGVLEQLPVDLLKIAARFVERLGTSRQRPRLVEAMVQLGDTLDLPTVAQGIENMTQLTQLRLLGCELGQGFHLSRPLQAKRVEGLLARAAADDPPLAASFPLT
jgi:diguanylate cyclase (GGDEF)-like protein/PAS domain S-box-containing protein